MGGPAMLSVVSERFKGPPIELDRTGASRNADRPAGKGPASPMSDDRGGGCGNDVPMETTERFPQGLGNLAQTARFPHSHSRFSSS